MGEWMSNKPVAVTIIVPCHNESATVELFHGAVTAALVDRLESWRLLFVDDGSTDRTRAILDGMAARDSRIGVLVLSRNFGKEAAMSAGLDQAGGDAVIVMDADLQHPPAMLPAMLDAWSKGGAQVVDCVKRSRGRETLMYKAASRLFNRIISDSAALDLRGSSDFKLLDRAVVEVLRHVPERTRFFRGLTEWVGFRHVRIEYDVAERAGGLRSWSMRSLLRYSINNVLVFSSVPLRLIASIGIWTVLVSIILGIQTLYMKFSGQAVEGFTTVILAVAFFSGVILLCLGIMGEYLSRMYDELKGRPRYIIAERNQAGDDD
jgi:glycosyltransferase involved in cell wall biosynthesis